ncbi:hypothetical protein CNMCM6936_002633 [Aspergillus lentulus]|uniref:Cyclochlorotine biosynthesis protein O n=1 Tax=Aspergillus lentulus TaxID=293939 RepID=A0AAN6BQF2_ASPLE|nr:hypothetical protein CNMCM6069_005855 [Aspergillus lentulus]KAF4162063.1 hypothetical protein CNMCM6936_002633 [Aspergillus lentulus]KAF4171894.1 hypothetical protein CNMCM8060_002280 [Aspergillus lentulus]KAF4191540.1 hypothetical protein CNMCM8694_001727 [Aspergillus lentulus]KAF4204765.1 hypothetical protein CNMCM8927_007034 [Aspergillus lentulus]
MQFSRLVRFFASEWTIERDLRSKHRDIFEARISQNSIFQSCYKEDVYPWVAKVFLRIWLITQDGNNTHLRYKNVVFNSGWGDQKSIYMGPPSEENNKAWDDVHVAPAMVKISASDAAKLVNKTVPIPDGSGYSSGYYLIGLDVFHQLHCLDMLRKVLWGVDMHNPNDEEAMHHLDHCIEMIRQSLMCSADITVDVWAWNEEKQMVTVRADNMHTCRDFEAIRQWALERPAGQFDRTIHLVDS